MEGRETCESELFIADSLDRLVLVHPGNLCREECCLDSFRYIKNINDKSIMVSPNWHSLFGVSSTEVESEYINNPFLSSFIAEKLDFNDSKVLEGNKVTYHTDFVRPDGLHRYILVNKYPLFKKDRHVYAILACIADISSSLQEITSKYEHLIASLPGSIYWKDSSGRYLGCNQLVANLAGLKNSHEIIGKTDYELIWSEQAENVGEHDRKIIESGEKMVFEEKVITHDGHVIEMLTKKEPLKDLEGNIIGVIGNSQDITERKILEGNLREARAREESLKALSALGGMVAHELRSPLLSIHAGVSAISDWLPHLLKGYSNWYDANTTEERPISPIKFKILSTHSMP